MLSQDSTPAQGDTPGPIPGLARIAGVLSIGNAASRALGLLREMVIAYHFGASGQVSAFRVAAQVPTLLYDFLIGGMLSAALVPVLSDYVRLRGRGEFAHLAGILLSLFACILAGLLLTLELVAPWIAWLLAAGFRQSNPELLNLTTGLVRIVAPAVWVSGMAGVAMAILYALQRFHAPALATAIYNLGIVLAAPLLASRIGISSLAVGILAGSLAQLALMAWDLRRAGLSIQFRIHWRHPALRRILRLYAPIVIGLVISLLQIGLDRRLASSTGEQSIAWMANATTLQQMPLGLISVAISLAALPRLSQYFAAQDEAAYRQTLGHGLRLVMVVIAPAAVVLWRLGEPITRLLFERGAFTPADTAQVVYALHIYLIGMLFAAVDFPLNYAFYARNNTLLPALVGVLSVVVYAATALSLIKTLGYIGLVWADTAKQASHALIMVGLLAWQVGRLHARMVQGLLSIALSAAVMASVIAGLAKFAAPVLPGGAAGDLWLLAAAGGSGLLTYGLVLALLGMREINELNTAIVRRLWK
jgi:putative peptidoglycan lipid II flippase